MNRTPKDFAIEFGGYLATNAEQLLRRLQTEDEARIRHDEDGTSDTERALEEAQEARGELVQALHGDVYEFRKRAGRAFGHAPSSAASRALAAGERQWRAATLADLHTNLIGQQIRTSDGEVRTVTAIAFNGAVHWDNGKQYAVRRIQVPVDAAAEAAVRSQHAELERDKAVQLLRAAGYAVVLFTPEELQGVEPNQVEDRLAEEGNEVISILKPVATVAEHSRGGA